MNKILFNEKNFGKSSSTRSIQKEYSKGIIIKPNKNKQSLPNLTSQFQNCSFINNQKLKTRNILQTSSSLNSNCHKELNNSITHRTNYQISSNISKYPNCSKPTTKKANWQRQLEISNIIGFSPTRSNRNNFLNNFIPSKKPSRISNFSNPIKTSNNISKDKLPKKSNKICNSFFEINEEINQENKWLKKNNMGKINQFQKQICIGDYNKFCNGNLNVKINCNKYDKFICGTKNSSYEASWKKEQSSLDNFFFEDSEFQTTNRDTKKTISKKSKGVDENDEGPEEIHFIFVKTFQKSKMMMLNISKKLNLHKDGIDTSYLDIEK